MSIYDLTNYGLDLHNSKPQTKTIQAVLDLAGQTGGTVIFPKGEYVTGGLLLHSNTEVFLEAGAHLLGSEDPSDYAVFEIPEGVQTRTDIDLQPMYFVENNKPRPEYRRAVFSAYDAENISIIGEGVDSVIDGQDCFDPEGEEGMRGPHGIFFSNCHNIILRNYTIQNCGNFHHQMDANENVHVSGLTALGGHDGFHLHCGKHILIEDCEFYTGDDCIAGVNLEDLTVRNCTLNTSCQLFRIGGNHIYVEHCRMYGPGKYPYRRSIMTSPGTFLPLTEGHHKVVSFMEYFASPAYPMEASSDIVFSDCTIENVGRLLWYREGVSTFEGCHLCGGTPLREITFKNVKISGMRESFETVSSAENPLTVRMIHCTCTDENGNEIPPLSENSANLKLIVE